MLCLDKIVILKFTLNRTIVLKEPRIETLDYDKSKIKNDNMQNRLTQIYLIQTAIVLYSFTGHRSGYVGVLQFSRSKIAHGLPSNTGKRRHWASSS